MRRLPASARRVAVRQHRDDLVELLAWQVAIWPSPGETLVQVVDTPFLRCHLRDDLLRQHVERRPLEPDRVELLPAHGVEQRR